MKEREGWCGPNVIQQIAEKEGIDITQSKLAESMNTSEKEGTTHDDLVRGARKLGLKSTPIRGLDIEELGHFTKSYHVVVNWMDGENDKDDGHYGILSRVENGMVYLNDATMSIEQFKKKWYDVEANGQRIDKWAMIISKR